MKVCRNCNIYYDDNIQYCSKCRRADFDPVRTPGVQVGGSPYQPQPGAYPAYPPQQPKNTNFKLGDFLKTFFKSPDQARKDAIARKDFLSAIILNVATVAMYFIYSLCLQCGLSIRYHAPFSFVNVFVYPTLFFIIIFGFQYLNVFVYSIYSKAKNKTAPAVHPALSSYMSLSLSKTFPIMTLALSALVSVVSPILGYILIPTTVVIGMLYAPIMSKISIGGKPKSLLDSFMFALTGIIGHSTIVLLLCLFVYLSARSMAEKIIYANMFNMFDLF